MKIKLMFFAVIFSLTMQSQRINVTNYGAIGNGVADDTNAFIKALEYAKKTYSVKKINSQIIVPAGTYNISSSLIFNKFISIEGEFVNNTIIRMKTENKELIIMEKNMDESVIYNSYNYIKNITLQGPLFAESPFVKKKDKNNLNSIGIKIWGLRTRISDVQIEGFSTAGIDIRSSYYNYITNCFIKNNGVGIILADTTTSAFINNNELRFNSIGIHIKSNSFANFINNNMIESNISHYIPFDYSENYEKTYSAGKGILIENSQSTIISENYFENQLVNISISNSNKNIVKNNFIAISDATINKSKNQVSLQLIGNSKNNTFESNSFLTSLITLNANKIILSNDDLSTNIIDVGEDNAKVKNALNNQFKSNNKLPKIGR